MTLTGEKMPSCPQCVQLWQMRWDLLGQLLDTAAVSLWKSEHSEQSFGEVKRLQV